MYGIIESSVGFYIGDICYVLSDEVYHDFWGKQKGYEDGVYTTPEGYTFAVASTAYGDGLYHDDEGNEYPVDAGVIGVVPQELIKKNGTEDGYFLEGTIAEFTANDGYFEIDILGGYGEYTVRINTRGEEVEE